MQALVAIVGPTATGKSDLGVSLAEHFHGEIVSADSRQIYRYMDIGTAKPSPEARSRVPHHLIDVVDPDQPFSLATYSSMARNAIAQIWARQYLPFVVGGSGQYVWSVLEDWQVPAVAPDETFRREMEARASREGPGALYRELEKADAESACRIGPTNVRRIIRALEILRSGVSPQKRGVHKLAMPAFIIGLTEPRPELYQRADARVDYMIENGLVAETKRLLEMGYRAGLTSMSGIGYRQIAMFLNGELDLTSAVKQIQYETHRLIRMQSNWFRQTDPRIHWFQIGSDLPSRVIGEIEVFLAAEE